jgi:hypothetical protein
MMHIYLFTWECILKKLFNDWGIIKDNVVAIVSDGASNIAKCIIDTFGSDKALFCYTHKLSILVRSSL